jgi:hypothetical protein
MAGMLCILTAYRLHVKGDLESMSWVIDILQAAIVLVILVAIALAIT